MQTELNGELQKSLIGSEKRLLEVGFKDLKEGKADKMTIATFKPNDVVEVRGLKFRVKRLNPSKKTLELKML